MLFASLPLVALLASAASPASAHRGSNARPHRRSLQYQQPTSTFALRTFPHLNLALPALSTAAAPTDLPAPTPVLHTVLAAQSTELPTIISPIAGMKSAQCGDSGAEAVSSYNGGPNGSEAWLTCGVSKMYPNSGWNPPFITIGDLKTIPLDIALKDPRTPFAACRPYTELFDKYGAETGIPPILLAAFAMQESSCQAMAIGDDGWAVGLMQITLDKCAAAPKGNCADPDYNIKTAAEYFAMTLAANNGDLLRSMGTYNGWYTDMTYNSANAIAPQCCKCVNNLDYMQQMLNWWVLGLDGSSAGTFRNVC